MAGIPGMPDRATLERERLARLAARATSTGTKRSRPITPPPMTRPAKVAKLSDGASGNMANSQEFDGKAETVQQGLDAAEVVDLTASPPSRPREVSSQPVSRTGTSSAVTPELKYPHGVIKKTWAFRHPRNGNDIKIEEVLEKSTLTTAVLSAFQWDLEWVFSKIDLARTKLVFVMSEKSGEKRDAVLKQWGDWKKVVRFCFPSMEGLINCMHSKLMLLFHPHKLRIVVPSANLTNYDWGETGIMENTVFLIDLPRLAKTDADQKVELTSFGEELSYFLRKQGLEDVSQHIRKFDFSATSDLAFVHTTGGAAYGDEMHRTGFLGLSKAVRELNLGSLHGLQIDFAASSIGSLRDALLNELYSAAMGSASMIPPPKTNKGATSQATAPSVREHFRIYFPTFDTVAASTGGTDSGGTICIQRQWWEGTNAFPRDCFRDYNSVRRGLLSHNKILYVRGHRAAERKDGKSEEVQKDVAWAYVGSANMSKSAWGEFSWDKARKEWKLNCRNWECGVVVRVPEEKLTEHDNGINHGRDRGVVPMSVFKGIVDVPFEYPGKIYQGREPWSIIAHGFLPDYRLAKRYGFGVVDYKF